MIVSPAFAGKRYAVLGLARSGLATVETLLASGAQVTAWDAREEPRRGLCGRVELADPLTIDLAGYDGVVVSPGVPLNRHPISEAAARYGVPVIGDIELFAQARAALPLHKVVGITGTNGKSTTTALVTHILTRAGVPALMGGNIGAPILGEAPLAAGGVYVLELSSYQIDLTLSLDCDVAVLLNVTPDHLDRYADFEAYRASKLRLFEMQSTRHDAVYDFNSVEAAMVEARRGGQAGTCWFTAEPVGLLARQDRWPALQGPHNLQDAAAAIMTCIALGLPVEAIARGLASYPGLPHRMERVADVGGVLFVNDSKATNPDSTAPALGAFPADPSSFTPGPRIHWICGGLAKDDNLNACVPYFGNVAAAYTIGEAGPLFADILAPHMPVHRSELMAEAIRQAIEAATPGQVVMLSPACASFDQFRDYEARGDTFRLLVEQFLGERAPTRAVG